MTEPGEGRRAVQPEDAPAKLWDLLDNFRTETEKMYSGEKGSADWEVARDAILVYVARRLRERTDTGEGAPVAEGFVHAVNVRRFESGLDATIDVQDEFATQHREGLWIPVVLVRRHQHTDEGEG